MRTNRIVARSSAICWPLPTTKDTEQHFGLALDTVYSVRDALSRLSEVALALAETRKFQTLLSRPSPHA
jgi:hypothetical protein